MTKLVRMRIDEDLLSRRSMGVSIDSQLPFRLQKTQLFKALGLPAKQTYPVSVKQEKEIESALEIFLKKRWPFFIVSSPKPMTTIIPPLVRINSAEAIIYRDTQGKSEPIELGSVLDKLNELPQNSWVEFTQNIWGHKTIAGRFLYVSPEEQILEIQRGVEPAELGRNRAGFFSIRCDFYRPANRIGLGKALHESDFSLNELRSILDCLADHNSGVEGLKRVGDLPTLEFGFTEQEGLQLIDADWPSQFIIVEQG